MLMVMVEICVEMKHALTFNAGKAIYALFQIVGLGYEEKSWWNGGQRKKGKCEIFTL